MWSDVPESAQGFAPHVSIAYSCSDGSVKPVGEALSQVEPATVRLDSVELIVLDRDHRMREWEPFAGIPLG